MKLTALFLLATTGLAMPRGMHAGSIAATCPIDDARASENVVRFLTSDNFAAVRAEHGMESVSPGNVRVLNDSQDSAICQQLRDGVQLGSGPYPRRAIYYYADGFYFVATRWVVPTNRVYLAPSPLLVFDSQLQFLGSYAM